MTQPTWGRGVGDDVWWRRRAQPTQPGGTDAEAPPQVQARTPAQAAPEPQALACDGVRRRPGPPPTDQGWRRVVAGRPVSAVTLALLTWGAVPLAAHGVTALLVSWDHASWPRRQAGRPWIRQHPQPVTRGAEGARLVACHVPSKRPWLTPIEPQWVHGTRAVAAPDRLLRADDLEARV